MNVHLYLFEKIEKFTQSSFSEIVVCVHLHLHLGNLADAFIQSELLHMCSLTLTIKSALLTTL